MSAAGGRPTSEFAQSGADDLGREVIVVHLRSAAAGLVDLQGGEAPALIPRSPELDRRLRGRGARSDLPVGDALDREQHDACAQHQALR